MTVSNRFNIVLEQSSPGMEQALSIAKEYTLMKEEVDLIKLIKTIEKLCYNYQYHDYPPLEA